MSKPKSYTIKVSFDNDAKLVQQATDAHTYPTTLLQEFVNNTIATNGKLVSSGAPTPPPAQNSFAANAEIKRLQAELQTANEALVLAQAEVQTANALLIAHNDAIEKIIKNAQAQFPISRNQLLKNVAI